MIIAENPRRVLTKEAVRLSIHSLQNAHIHEQFLGYLHARKCGIEQGTMAGIQPDWSEVGNLLAVDGGPPNKPHFLPMTSRTKNDPSRYWLNPNIPGSFAPSSLRRASEFMRGTSQGKFDLPASHVEQALENHLNGKRRPIWPLAGFLLRNYSFRPASHGSEPHEGAPELIQAFRAVFRFDAEGSDSDFEKLFTVGNEPDIVWFEDIADPAEERSDG